MSGQAEPAPVTKPVTRMTIYGIEANLFSTATVVRGETADFLKLRIRRRS